MRWLDAPLWRQWTELAPRVPRVLSTDLPVISCRPIDPGCRLGLEVLRSRQPVHQRIARRAGERGRREAAYCGYYGKKTAVPGLCGPAARVPRHLRQDRPRGPGFGLEVTSARRVIPGISGPKSGRDVRTLSALPSYNPTSSACTPKAVTVSRTCWLLTSLESNSTTMRCGRSS